MHRKVLAQPLSDGTRLVQYPKITLVGEHVDDVVESSKGVALPLVEELLEAFAYHTVDEIGFERHAVVQQVFVLLHDRLLAVEIEGAEVAGSQRPERSASKGHCFGMHAR